MCMNSQRRLRRADALVQAVGDVVVSVFATVVWWDTDSYIYDWQCYDWWPYDWYVYGSACLVLWYVSRYCCEEKHF